MDKQVKILRPSRAKKDGWYSPQVSGHVDVPVALAYLKTHPTSVCRITKDEALALAEQLINAARFCDGT